MTLRQENMTRPSKQKNKNKKSFHNSCIILLPVYYTELSLQKDLTIIFFTYVYFSVWDQDKNGKKIFPHGRENHLL